ncbi:sialate:O-sulfotransferase 1-like [Glandiceps talaboti]
MELGLAGELEDINLGTTLTVKTHKRMSTHFDAAILLIRDPYKALVTYFQFKRAGHTGVAPPSVFNGTDWREFVSVESAVWEEHATTWLDFPNPLLVVKYEDLKMYTTREVRKITHFLGVPITETERYECLKNNLEGNFKRKSDGKEQRDLFTPEMHEEVDSHIRAVNNLLTARNIPELKRDYE